MLGSRRHTGVPHAIGKGHCQFRDDLGIAVEGPIPDDRADAIVEIDDRRKTHIDPDGQQFRRQQPAALARQLPARRRVDVVFAPDGAHRWQDGEVLAETLYPPALMVNGDQ